MPTERTDTPEYLAAREASVTLRRTTLGTIRAVAAEANAEQLPAILSLIDLVLNYGYAEFTLGQEMMRH